MPYLHKFSPVLQYIFILLMLVLLSVVLLVPQPILAQETDPWEAAAEESLDEFKTVKSTLSETIEKLDEVKEKIEQFEILIEGTLAEQELEDALKIIRDAKGSLESKIEIMKLADSKLTSVGSVIDGAVDLKTVIDTATSRRGGSLATSMSLLGEAMKRYGGEVPWAGDFIVFYGEAVTGMLDATDKLAKSIDSNIRQGTLSSLGIDDPKVKAIIEQFGEGFLDNHTLLAPTITPNLYEDLGSAQGDFTLIWNPTTKVWTRSEHSAAQIRSLYRSYLMVNGRPNIDQLIALATVSFDATTARLNTGEDAFELLTRLSDSYIFDNVNKANEYPLAEFLVDRDLFIASYAHDQEINRTIASMIRQIYQEALDRNEGTIIEQIEAWAQKQNFDLGSEQGVQLGDVDSVVILFDASGSMGDNGKITSAKRAAHNVLTRMGDETQVALIVFYDCGWIVVEQDFTTDADLLLAKVEAISPSGSTPLAGAISFAKAYIQEKLDGGKARLMVLSDGEETCGGDPISAARQ